MPTGVGPLRFKQAALDRRFAVLSLCFAACYLWIIRGIRVHQITDTALYRHIADESLSWAWFTANRRPPLYPLLIKLCGDHGRIVVALQIATYLASWMVLAWTFYRPLSARGLRVRAWLMAAGTFYVALYPDFAGWNHVLMTESLSVSGQVLVVVFLVRFLLNRAGRDLVFMALTAAASSLLRDVNGYACLFLILPLLAIAGRSLAGPRLVAFPVVILLVGAGFMMWTSDGPSGARFEGRWIFPMLNVMGKRILPSAPASAYFEAHGMPMNDTLRSMSGRFAYQGRYDWQFSLDPDLQAFREWLVARGRPTYLNYLVFHPRTTFGRVWNDRLDLFQPLGYRLDAYPDTRYSSAATPRGFTYPTGYPPRIPLVMAYLMSSLGSVSLLVAGRVQRNVRWLDAGLVLGALVLALIPMAILVEHGDSMETARHAIFIPAQAVLTALAVIFSLVSEKRPLAPAVQRPAGAATGSARL